MKNWIFNEIEKSDQENDLIILENPIHKSIIDSVILDNLWPYIKKMLEKSGYIYYPDQDIELITNIGKNLERKLTFSMFDNGLVFFKGNLICGKHAWFLTSNFFLCLLKENNSELIHELIGNSRFTGNPPTLIINKINRRIYYQINFHNGCGLEFPFEIEKLIWNTYAYQELKTKLKETIETNIKMYEMTKTGMLNKDNLSEFITLAYNVYEAY